MSTYLLKNARLVNRGVIRSVDILISGGRIEKIATRIDHAGAQEIAVDGKYVLPGIIDDQVHFREPGLTHKAEIYTEAKAAVAGGTTSFMEMPNTKPTTTTQEKLAEKYQVGHARSLANYSFYMGATNENLDEVLRTDQERVCGIKIFMGSSTGNMLVDAEETLEGLFSKVPPMLIATHCEDEETVRANLALAIDTYGENIPIDQHPVIRNVEACYKSSSLAVELAKKHGTRLHILHISTAKELDLFRNDISLEDKKITAEVCVHHLYFDADDYATLGSQIKCNPAVKDASNRAALLPALLDERIDVIATDHAPHTWAEKQNPYLSCPSGVPLVQHSLNVMLGFYHKNLITLEQIVEKMSHNVADCFRIKDRGYADEGMWADLIVVDVDQEWTVGLENILYKCSWSPFLGRKFKGRVLKTFVSGHLAYDNGVFDESKTGERLLFKKS